jgi:hypothetical protein
LFNHSSHARTPQRFRNESKALPKSHILDAVHDTARGLFAGIARRLVDIASQAMHRQEASYTRVWAYSYIDNLHAMAR